MKMQKWIDGIKAGHTLYISTRLRTTKITPRTLKSWEASGRPLIKDGREGENGFYLASGRKYVYYPDGSFKLLLIKSL